MNYVRINPLLNKYNITTTPGIAINVIIIVNYLTNNNTNKDK